MTAFQLLKMHKFVRNLLTEWRKLGLPFDGETFVIAVSGGADSVSLAIALDDLSRRKKLKLRFVIAHFNHALRGAESDNDADFVENLARALDLEFAFEKGNVPKKGNLEQNARLARYRFLTQTAENLDAFGILTAHTVNDQAETFLLNLIRGSGIAGLSAIKPVLTNYKLQITNSKEEAQITDRRETSHSELEAHSKDKSAIHNPKSEIALVRPLLRWAKREDTEAFCLENRVEFRRDAMNEDLNFKRVRLRKILLPALREFNPKIVETLARTAELFRIESESLFKTKDQNTKAVNRFLSLKDLKALSKPALYQILREWLAAHRGNLRAIDLKHIEAIERLIFSPKSGRVVELPSGAAVIKKDGKLYCRRRNVENTD